MKPSIVIINTARGAVMDEAALVDALKEGKVASVGLDVFEEEPKVHPGLIENPNVLLLPHMGTWSVEVRFFRSLEFAFWVLSRKKERVGDWWRSGSGSGVRIEVELRLGLGLGLGLALALGLGLGPGILATALTISNRLKRPWNTGASQTCARQSRKAS